MINIINKWCIKLEHEIKKINVIRVVQEWDLRLKAYTIKCIFRNGVAERGLDLSG